MAEFRLKTMFLSTDKYRKKTRGSDTGYIALVT